MPSRWVKVLPWYYTERRQPTRAAEFRRALTNEEASVSEGAARSNIQVQPAEVNVIDQEPGIP